jgi:hypothetical protein
MYPLFISFFDEDKTELGIFPHPRSLSILTPGPSPKWRGEEYERVGGDLPYRKYLTMKADGDLNSQLSTLIGEASMSKINDTFIY